MIILKTAKESFSSLFDLSELELECLGRDFLQSEKDYVEIPRLIPVSRLNRTIIYFVLCYFHPFIVLKVAPFLFSPSTRTK